MGGKRTWLWTLPGGLEDGSVGKVIADLGLEGWVGVFLKERQGNSVEEMTHTINYGPTSLKCEEASEQLYQTCS